MAYADIGCARIIVLFDDAAAKTRKLDGRCKARPTEGTHPQVHKSSPFRFDHPNQGGAEIGPIFFGPR
jgi:hypothetical protein